MLLKCIKKIAIYLGRTLMFFDMIEEGGYYAFYGVILEISNKIK